MKHKAGSILVEDYAYVSIYYCSMLSVNVCSVSISGCIMRDRVDRGWGWSMCPSACCECCRCGRVIVDVAVRGVQWGPSSRITRSVMSAS